MLWARAAGVGRTSTTDRSLIPSSEVRLSQFTAIVRRQSERSDGVVVGGGVHVVVINLKRVARKLGSVDARQSLKYFFNWIFNLIIWWIRIWTPLQARDQHLAAVARSRAWSISVSQAFLFHPSGAGVLAMTGKG